MLGDITKDTKNFEDFVASLHLGEKYTSTVCCLDHITFPQNGKEQFWREMQCRSRSAAPYQDWSPQRGFSLRSVFESRRSDRQHERSSKGVPGAVFPTSLRGEGKSHQVRFARRKGERFWVRVRLVWRGLQCTPVGNGDERCRTLFLPVSADRLRLSLETGKGYQVLLFQRHSRQLR